MGGGDGFLLWCFSFFKKINEQTYMASNYLLSSIYLDINKISFRLYSCTHNYNNMLFWHADHMNLRTLWCVCSLGFHGKALVVGSCRGRASRAKPSTALVRTRTAPAAPKGPTYHCQSWASTSQREEVKKNLNSLLVCHRTCMLEYLKPCWLTQLHAS